MSFIDSQYAPGYPKHFTIKYLMYSSSICRECILINPIIQMENAGTGVKSAAQS